MAQKLLTRKQKRNRRLLLGIGLLCVCGVLYILVYASFFRSIHIEIIGARHTDVAAVTIEINGLLREKTFGIIPNDHIAFYPKKKIRELVLTRYPSVETINMSVDMKKKLEIRITDRKPMGVWCGEKCYFYDAEGIIFKESFKYIGPVFTSWEKSPKEEVGFLKQVSCEQLCTNSAFTDFLKAYQIEKVILSESMIELISANGYKIKAGFNATTTMEHIKKISEQKHEFLETLEYIDVRFPTKIFYKEKGV